jgi:hypothetical protein
MAHEFARKPRSRASRNYRSRAQCEMKNGAVWVGASIVVGRSSRWNCSGATTTESIASGVKHSNRSNDGRLTDMSATAWHTGPLSHGRLGCGAFPFDDSSASRDSSGQQGHDSELSSWHSEAVVVAGNRRQTHTPLGRSMGETTSNKTTKRSKRRLPSLVKDSRATAKKQRKVGRPSTRPAGSLRLPHHGHENFAGEATRKQVGATAVGMDAIVEHFLFQPVEGVDELDLVPAT